MPRDQETLKPLRWQDIVSSEYQELLAKFKQRQAQAKVMDDGKGEPGGMAAMKEILKGEGEGREL